MRHTNCCGKRLDFWFLSWPALDTFDEPCWTQSLTFINGCHWSGYICAEIVNCTLRLIIICYGVYRRGLRDNMRQRSHMQQHTITGRSLTFFFSPFSFIYTRCSLCPHVSLAQRDAGFWQCPSSLLASEHLRDEMHPDTQGWFSPPLTPAGGRHDLITGGDE